MPKITDCSAQGEETFVGNLAAELDGGDDLEDPGHDRPGRNAKQQHDDGDHGRDEDDYPGHDTEHARLGQPPAISACRVSPCGKPRSIRAPRRPARTHQGSGEAEDLLGLLLVVEARYYQMRHDASPSLASHPECLTL